MRMMSRCFTWFPIGGYRRTKYIQRFGGVLQEQGILLGGLFLDKMELVQLAQL